MNVLVVTTVLPSRLATGGEIASSAFVDAMLAMGCDVDVCGYVRPGARAGSPREIVVGARPIETRRAPLRAAGWMLGALLRGAPYSSFKYVSREYERLVARALAAKGYEAVLVDHAQMAWLLPRLELAGRIFFLAHNAESRMYLEQAAASRALARRVLFEREARLIERAEESLLRRAEQVWTLSRDDAAYFRGRSPAGEVVCFDLPSALRSLEGPPPEASSDIGLIGTWSWGPNRAGLEWFFDEVSPHLRRGLRIDVAGTGADWLRGRFAGVRVLGFVDDAARFMRGCRVLAIPSVQGGGVQVKTLDAVASGCPVVATGIALRGIVDPPASVSVADEAASFARALHELLDAPDSAALGAEGRAWTRAREQRFRETLERALGQPAGPGEEVAPAAERLTPA